MSKFEGRKYIYPMVFLDEEWKEIYPINNIDRKYQISNYGRVYNSESDLILDGSIADNGYVTVQLRTVDGERKYCHVHRLVMLVFCPTNNSDDLEVNHKNGCKQDNMLSNLEWNTHKENVQHSLKTGLRGIGENSPHSIFSDLQVTEICKLMEQGYGPNDISFIVFGKPYCQQYKTLFYYIRTRSNWIHISKDYKVENYNTISQ